MDGMLSVSLTADVDQFTKNFKAVSNVAAATGQSVSVSAANMSKNIESLNRVNMNGFNAALSAGQISVTKFTRSSDQMVLDLAKLQQQFGKTTNPVTLLKLQTEIKKTESELKRLKSFSESGIFEPLSKYSSRAGQSMSDFSRIVQDAPFGFIAIQNNLNPMLESFTRLRNETGSTGGALKAMAGQLTGAGGIGVGLALVTSAITAYTMYQQKANKAVKEAKDETEDYVKTLNQLDQAKVRGAQDAQKEITELNTLYSISQNVNLSTKQRVNAVNELQSKYPEYFKNLKDETILNGGAKDAYDRLSKSIIATARARAAQGLITENSKEQLILEQKIADLEVKRLKETAEAQKNLDTIKKGGTGVSAQGFADMAEKSEKRAAEALAEQVKYKKEIETLTAKSVKLTESVTKEVQKGADLSGKVGDIPKSTEKKVKSLSDVLKELNVDLTQVENKVGSTFDDKQKGKVTSYQKAIDELIKIGFNASSDAVLSLKSSMDTVFSEQNKKKAEEFFNFVLPNRLAGESAETVKKEAEKQKKALQEAIKQGEADWQEFRNPSASDKVEKSNFVMSFDKSDIQIEMDSIKSAMDSMSKTFDESGGSLDDFKQKYSDLVGELRRGEFVEQLNVLAEGFITSGIQDIAGAVGEALVNGTSVLGAAGGALLGAFGKFLSEYGDLLIAYGAAAVLKGKLDLAAMIPGAGILAGTAAIAAGFALKVAGAAIASFASGKNSSNSKGNERKPTAFANGGIISGPTYGLMGEYSGAKNNPEVVAPLSKLKGMIADTSGGGEINTRIDIEGEQLFIILERTKRRLERSN